MSFGIYAVLQNMSGLEKKYNILGKIYSISDEYIVVKPSMVLFAIFIVDMYLEIPLLISTNVVIPGILMLFAIPFVVLVVKARIEKTDVFLLLQVMSITFASILFTSRIGFINVLLIKIVQFVVSVSTGLLLFKLMDNISLIRQRKMYLILSFTLLIGCFLEVHIGLFKGISDAFRSIYEGTMYNPYDNSNRDVDLTGFERPKFFTSEPSLAALGYMIFSTAYLLLTISTSRFVLVLIMDLMFVVVSGSPINFLNILIWTVLYIYQFPITQRTIGIGLASVTGLFLISWQGGIFNKILESAINRIIEETFLPSSSLFGRLYIPYVEALPAALHNNWAFGVGYGGKDVLALLDYANSVIKLESETGSNAFARFFIYFGIVGGALMLRCFYSYCRKKEITEIKLLLFIWTIYSQAIGSMESPRYWAYIFLLIGVFRARAIYPIKIAQPISQI